MCKEGQCPGAAWEEKLCEPREMVEILRRVAEEGMPAWVWWTINRIADAVVWLTGGPRRDSG